jgi:hypothetical protein
MANLYHLAHIETARRVAIITAWISAALYALIGLGVLPIGQSASGGDPGLFDFGVMMAAVFVVTALLLMLFRSTVLWVAVAVLQFAVLIGYAALSGYRIPAFEVWGLLVKVDQAILLAATLYLVIRGRQHAPATTSRHAS